MCGFADCGRRNGWVGWWQFNSGGDEDAILEARVDLAPDDVGRGSRRGYTRADSAVRISAVLRTQ